MIIKLNDIYKLQERRILNYITEHIFHKFNLFAPKHKYFYLRRILKSIQELRLPKRRKTNHFKFDYIFKPKDFISGDIFDFYYIDDENIVLYISDVMGHGFRTLYLTLFIKKMIRKISQKKFMPKEVIDMIYKVISKNILFEDRYFTLFFGVINIKSKTLTYCNAGHNCPPILINNNNIKTLELNGPIISTLFDNPEYEQKTITITSGLKLLFYTDGIIESRNEFKEEFGIVNLINALKNSYDKSILKNIKREVENFSKGKNKDDYTAFIVEIL